MGLGPGAPMGRGNRRRQRERGDVAPQHSSPSNNSSRLRRLFGPLTLERLEDRAFIGGALTLGAAGLEINWPDLYSVQQPLKAQERARLLSNAAAAALREAH